MAISFTQAMALKFAECDTKFSINGIEMYLLSSEICVKIRNNSIEFPVSGVEYNNLPAQLVKYYPQLTILVPFADVTVLSIKASSDSVKKELLEYFTSSVVN